MSEPVSLMCRIFNSASVFFDFNDEPHFRFLACFVLCLMDHCKSHNITNVIEWIYCKYVQIVKSTKSICKC